MATETLNPIDRIQKAFQDLETQKTLISNCFLPWQNISDHFSSLEKTLSDRSHSLDLNLDLLESQRTQTLETLTQRESSMPQQEASAAALIADRRDAVIAEIEDRESKPVTNLKAILRWHCRRMDSSGLWGLMVERRKEIEVFRREIREALDESLDALRLVLDVVEDFVGNPVDEDMDCLGVLVKGLFDLAGKKEGGIAGGVRDRAGIVAERWRRNCEGKKGIEGAEARVFLRMVVLFDLRKRFEEDFLLKLVVENEGRKEMKKIGDMLGFGVGIQGMEFFHVF